MNKCDMCGNLKRKNGDLMFCIHYGMFIRHKKECNGFEHMIDDLEKEGVTDANNKRFKTKTGVTA